jgi:hypothetical protein
MASASLRTLSLIPPEEQEDSFFFMDCFLLLISFGPDTVSLTVAGSFLTVELYIWSVDKPLLSMSSTSSKRLGSFL